MLSDYDRQYMSSREERHAYSGVAGTYGVERLQSGGYSGSDVRNMLRKNEYPTVPKNMPKKVRLPKPQDFRPKTKVGKLVRRVKAGLTPGGYRAYVTKERERYAKARRAAILNNEKRSPDEFFKTDTLSSISGAAGEYAGMLRREGATKQERRASQKFFKEVNKGIDRRFGSNAKRLSRSAHGRTPLAVPRGNLPEEKEIQSVPSKFVRIRDPKRRPRSTDAAITEATKRAIRKRVEQTGIAPLGVRTPYFNSEPLDSAGSVGFAGPTGRTAHENL
jgi:hypothetical protein